MNERTNEQHLSTADMVAAADRPDGGTSAVATASERRNGEAANKQMATGATPNGAGRIDGASTDERSTPLLSSDESAGFRSRWDSIQTSFVDEPRKAVEQADGLVADSIKRLAEVFAKERSGLEQQWSRGDEVDTDDLRQAMLRYRSFFERLLSV